MLATKVGKGCAHMSKAKLDMLTQTKKTSQIPIQTHTKKKTTGT